VFVSLAAVYGLFYLLRMAVSAVLGLAGGKDFKALVAMPVLQGLVMIARAGSQAAV